MSSEISIPPSNVLESIWKMAQKLDKSIKTDYWEPSFKGEAFLGVCNRVDSNGKTVQDKLLAKSNDEFTSNIVKLSAAKDCIVVETENSIYVISKNIPKKNIQTE